MTWFRRPGCARPACRTRVDNLGDLCEVCEQLWAEMQDIQERMLSLYPVLIQRRRRR